MRVSIIPYDGDSDYTSEYFWLKAGLVHDLNMVRLGRSKSVPIFEDETEADDYWEDIFKKQLGQPLSIPVESNTSTGHLIAQLSSSLGLEQIDKKTWWQRQWPTGKPSEPS